jgi:hypothetical protein
MLSLSLYCSFQFNNTHPPAAIPPNDPIDLTVDTRDLLPQDIIDEWLPGEEKSVLSLLQEFSQYPPHPSHYTLPSNLQSVLHQDEVQAFNYGSLLTIGPPALPSILKAYQDAIKKSPHPVLSITLKLYYGDPVQLPVWVFDYWVEIECVVDIWK